jgi:uncharacterized protein YcbK (DUF882 family)
MSFTFLFYLDKVREESGGPIIVNSGFRCNSHNINIGGAKNSWHTKGLASDCVPTKVSLKELKDIADKYFDEVIVYEDKGFVHIAQVKRNL